MLALQLRPLGRVSAFAAHGRVPLAELDAAAGALLIGSPTVPGSGFPTRLAETDVKVAVHRLVGAGVDPPESLRALRRVVARAAGCTEALTYEDLVLNNPLAEEPRLLTAGAAAGHEQDFYATHVRIESLFAESTGLARGAGESGIARTVWLVSTAAAIVDTARAELRALGTRLPPAHFGELRRAIGAGMDAGVPGPSRRFSAAVPLLETVVAGEAAWTSERQAEFDSHRELFPPAGVAEIEEARAAARADGSLLERAARLPAIAAAVAALAWAIRDFRAHHMGTVHRLVARDEAGALLPGTGGIVGVSDFLRARRDPAYLDTVPAPGLSPLEGVI